MRLNTMQTNMQRYRSTYAVFLYCIVLQPIAKSSDFCQRCVGVLCSLPTFFMCLGQQVDMRQRCIR